MRERKSFIDANSENAQVQEALDSLSHSDLLGFRRQDNPPVISVASAVRSAGYFTRHQDVHVFVETLKKSRVPVGQIQRLSEGKVQNYYIVAAREPERIRQAFDNHPAITERSANLL